MAIFELPKDFNPESLIYKYYEEDAVFQKNLKIRTLIEIRRLNGLGAQISDYLSLIKSANLQLSDFEALSLAIELLKVERLKQLEVTGNVDATISGNVDAGISGSISTE
jgi:hypothetical protein